MKLNIVTITGVDDQTSIDDLHSLHTKYPFVEWGILFSGSRAGSPKYPTTSKIMNIGCSGMPVSAHFCGTYSKEVLESKNGFILFTTYLIGFNRIQLNYNFGEFPMRWTLQAASEFSGKFPKVPLILQYNDTNKESVVAEIWRERINLHVLYDSSGGRGLSTAKVDPPLPVYTGYSGGLGPDNIEKFVKELTEYPNPAPVWIDMEANVRTGDRLDLEKVEKVLEICSKYITV